MTTFVDTNVLVYAHDLSETQRRPVARAALDALWRTRSGTTSTQVLSEFYVVATRKFDPPKKTDDPDGGVAEPADKPEGRPAVGAYRRKAS